MGRYAEARRLLFEQGRRVRSLSTAGEREGRGGEARALRLCRFAHPWVPDNVSLDSVPVTFGAATWPFVRVVLVWAVGEGWARMVVPVIVVVVCVVVGRRCLRR